jgi:hypothetical protein
MLRAQNFGAKPPSWDTGPLNDIKGDDLAVTDQLCRACQNASRSSDYLRKFPILFENTPLCSLSEDEIETWDNERPTEVFEWLTFGEFLVCQQSRCHLCAIIEYIVTTNQTGTVKQFFSKTHEASEQLKLAVTPRRVEQVCCVELWDCQGQSITEVLTIYSNQGSE